MITPEQISSLAKTTGLRPHQQEKNYVQTVVLRSLYSESPGSLVFKGGTALMFAFGLRRFSDDLDFTGSPSLDAKKLVERAATDLKNLGMPSKAKQESDRRTGESYRLSVERPLYSSPVSIVSVKVEVSHREEVIRKPIPLYLDPIYPDVPPFTYLVMDPGEIVSEKVRAILTRHQARDIFDLAFLLKKGYTTTVEEIDRKLDHYHLRFDRGAFRRRLAERKALWKPEMDPIVVGKVPDYVDTVGTIEGHLSAWAGRL
jgi:predicted nucleotidyltransferase component of viral defense system